MQISAVLEDVSLFASSFDSYMSIWHHNVTTLFRTCFSKYFDHNSQVHLAPSVLGPSREAAHPVLVLHLHSEPCHSRSFRGCSSWAASAAIGHRWEAPLAQYCISTRHHSLAHVTSLLFEPVPTAQLNVSFILELHHSWMGIEVSSSENLVHCIHLWIF